MRKLIIVAAGIAAAMMPSTASAQYGRYPGGGYYGGGNYGPHGYNRNRAVNREIRECRRELRRADSRREYRRELRECRREIARAQRRSHRNYYRGW